MATIAEVLNNRDNYKANGIDKVIIDGNEFSDYAAFSFVWEKSYVKSPERSANGSIGNLDSYPTFITPHLKIDFSLMSIDSYRKLMSLVYMKNEFKVTCYDVVNNRMTTNSMYFSTEEMPKLWNIAKIASSENGMEEIVYLLGVHEYTVEMIGTNNIIDNNQIQVWYKNVNGTGINTQPYVVYDGEDFMIGTGITTNYSKWKMENGIIVSTWEVITLHAFGSQGMTNAYFTALH